MLKKVAFLGSVGSGKTTIINQLSSIETVDTDVESSIDIGKQFTTVGIDYGHIHIDKENSLGLYGVPGQRRFSFIWDFVKEGLWAVVILVKHNDLESFQEIEHLMDYFAVDKNTPCVVGVTHAENARRDIFINKIHEKMQARDLNLPIYTVDGRSLESAMLIMKTLIAIQESIDMEITN